MAELGIAASGIGIASLALQVGDCIVRLKKFWEEVKDAPEEIKNLMEEIETLSIVLSEFETSDQVGLNVWIGSTSRCLQSCQKAVAILTGVIKEFEKEVKKRRLLGSMKAVMKKNAIEKLRERLTAAQSMLMISNQIYMLELQKRNQQANHDWAQTHQQELQQLRVIVTQSAQDCMSSSSFQLSSKQALKTIETSSSSYQAKSFTRDDALERKHRKFKNQSKQNSELKAQFWVPKWLLGVSRTIEIYESRSQAGWNFNIQVYNVIPRDSPIFQMAEDGDVDGIEQLFSRGQASPFDRDQYGATVLDYAAVYKNLTACRLLINEGANPNTSASSSALVEACKYSLKLDLQTDLDVIRLLAQYTEIPDLFDIKDFNFLGHAEVLEWLLHYSTSNYQQKSLEECVLFAIKICYNRQPNLASLVRIILKLRTIDATTCCISDEKGNTLLHCAVWNLGFILAHRKSLTEDLLVLVGELVHGGSQLHAVTLESTTPMLLMLRSFFWNGATLSFEELEVNMALLLKTWLKQLKDSGVDLVEYGEGEKRILQRPSTLREYEHYRREGGRNSFRRWHLIRLINFTCGPEPDDWTLYFEPVMEDYFMEFWDMIDHPERGIPGAWIE